MVFFIYDIVVQRRNDRLVKKAAQSGAIVTSLFPGALREKVFQENNPLGQSRGMGELTSYLRGHGKQGDEEKKYGLVISATCRALLGDNRHGKRVCVESKTNARKTISNTVV